MSSSFPVVFFDGKLETDAGNVGIDPASFRFKKFESVIKKMIGINPHRPISIFFFCRKNPNSAAGFRRKIPIHENSNFTAIAREKDGCFHVELKPSKQEVLGNSRRNLESGDFMLLRRDVAPDPGRIPLFSGEGVGLGFLEYEKNLHLRPELQRHREEHLISTNPYTVGSGYGYDARRTVAVCKECTGAKERPVPFHSCVYDTVTFGFRSPAGPIQRPSKAKTGF